MTKPLTPREWAERAFDGIKANESLFAAVERVIGEAMAAKGETSGGLVARLREEATEKCQQSFDSVDAGIASNLAEAAADRIDQLERALTNLLYVVEASGAFYEEGLGWKETIAECEKALGRP